MIDFDETIINNIIFHRIGMDQSLSFLNDVEYKLDDETEEDLLKKIFLKPFSASLSTYEFKHDIDIELNVLFKVARDIQNDIDFVENSKNIHQHLKNVSKHPNIKDGDLFVMKFDNIMVQNSYYQALGIYKVENKESFIETNHSDNSKSDLRFKKGISMRKLDKAVLILYTEEPYTVLVIDNTSVETDYWINEFAKVDYRKDYVNSTNQFMTLTKSFITERVPDEYEITKADQIDLLNRSVDYFKSHDTFEKNEFEQEVFQESAVIESFHSFDEEYSKEKDIDLDNSFEISVQAVKKQARAFKSVLKLDKNFHIYIHGNKELIEQGVEKDGRKYYKIYYEDEK